MVYITFNKNNKSLYSNNIGQELGLKAIIYFLWLLL